MKRSEIRGCIPRAKSRIALRSIRATLAVSDRPAERFRIINGLAAGDRLNPGDQVKVVVE